MVDPLEFPGLALAERPALFAALIEADLPSSQVLPVSFAGRRGWLVLDETIARNILRSRSAAKGRRSESHLAVGGYPARTAGLSHDRSRVVIALESASRDRARMRASLDQIVPAGFPDRQERPAQLTAWMTTDLAGTPVEADLLAKAVSASLDLAEAAQRGTAGRPIDTATRTSFLNGLVQQVSTAESTFVESLTQAGWGPQEIAEEILALAVAGWESTAAAITTAVTMGLPLAVTDEQVDLLLRTYPPSWLMTRELGVAEAWGASAGDLVAISPWLQARRGGTSLPFGAGQRRCPADAYARAQIGVGLSRFGGAKPQPAVGELLHRRSAAMVPEERP